MKRYCDKRNRGRKIRLDGKINQARDSRTLGQRNGSPLLSAPFSFRLQQQEDKERMWIIRNEI